MKAEVKNTTHTPGPWVFEDDAIMAECGVHICTPNTADDFPCIEPDTYDEAQSECEANARLMAASPELLEALKLCVANIQGVADEEDIPSTAIRVKARAAIAKAEGRS